VVTVLKNQNRQRRQVRPGGGRVCRVSKPQLSHAPSLPVAVLRRRVQVRVREDAEEVQGRGGRCV